MIATLEFELPQESDEYYYAIHGTDYSLVIWDIDQWLRERIKYDESMSGSEKEIYQEVREKLWETAQYHSVEIG